jgi:DNA-binding CsgD family transcriptional regulator
MDEVASANCQSFVPHAMHFTTEDLHLLLALTDLLGKPSRLSLIDRADVIQKLASLFHADFIGHAVWNRRADRFEQAAHWGRDAQMAVEYEQHFQFIDPISPLLTGRENPVLSDSVIDRRTFRKTEYFSDFLSSYRVYSGVDLYPHEAGQLQFNYRFWTSNPKKRFGEREVSLLNILRPYLINEYHLRSAARIDKQPDAAGGNYPSFLVQKSKDLKPNRKARKLLAGLEPVEGEALCRLISLIPYDPSATLHWKGFNLCIEYAAHECGKGHAYRVHLLARTVGSGSWLQQQFDLTLREGEICHLLLKGLADKQIATTLKISYWTVRIHVGRILEKLAIDSRAGVGLAVLKASHGATVDGEHLLRAPSIVLKS